MTKGKMNPEKTDFNAKELAGWSEAKFKAWFEALYEGNAKEWHAKIKKEAGK